MSSILLNDVYEYNCQTVSDINEHIPVLDKYARDCNSVMEIGIRTMVSTWGVLHGLANSIHTGKKLYTGIDLEEPPKDKLDLAKKICLEHNINFNFYAVDDMKIAFISPVDMIFIDSMHTYIHLTYELENFCDHVNKYICFHDIDFPWGLQDEPYKGDYTEYPIEYSRTKRGLLTAVYDFLSRHPEWEFYEHRKNNHGFGVLKRIPGEIIKKK